MRARTHSRASAPIFIAIALLSASGVAFAWNFDEHEAFGDRGFVKACEQAQASAKKQPNYDSSALAGMLRDGLTCSTVVLAARRSYGELTALAGDIIESPYVFTDHPSEIESLSKSTLSYLRLAHYNVEHFQPHSLHTYQFYHRAALLEAMTAVTCKSEEADGGCPKEPDLNVARLRRALAINAFADHFLADSFAAGHIRPDRKSLPDRLSKRVHDRDNKRNTGANCWKVTNLTTVQSQDGGKVENRVDEWCPHGDGSLSKTIAENRPDPELDRIVAATALSVGEVFAAIEQPDEWRQRVGVGNNAIERSRFEALTLAPRRPACTEQPSLLGNTPCYDPWDFGEVGLGIGTDEWIGMANSAQTLTANLAWAFIYFFGAELQIDLWERASDRDAAFSGGTASFATLRPSVFLRSWPRRDTYTGFEWIYGARIGYPLFWAPWASGASKRLRDNIDHPGFPDVGAYFDILIYSLDVRFEMGFGSFLAF